MSDERSDMAQLRMALEDLGYAIFGALGIDRLARRLGFGEPRQWFREAESRAQWRKKA